MDALQRPLDGARSLHQFQNAWAGVLQRYIQVGKDLAIAHQRDQIVHMGIGVDVMHADPEPQLAELFTQRQHAGLDGGSVIEAGSVFDIRAVGRGILRDHQQLFDSGLFQPLGLGQHLPDGAAFQIATQ